MSLGLRLGSFIQSSWQRRGLISWLLSPVGLIYCLYAQLRRVAYTAGMLPITRCPVPLIVVGNLTVGGSGKTPLVIAMVEHLREGGRRPGVVSRGYRGSAEDWPRVVNHDSRPSEVGDEPVLIAKRTLCPVVVDPDRCRAVDKLLRDHDCDVVVSDDGLQHYRMGRSMEVVVIDGVHRMGNGFCLPAGPLRESRSRALSADLIVCNGGFPQPGEHRMRLRPQPLANLADPRRQADIEAFCQNKAHAVAGIGHPDRFFHDLKRRGLAIYEHAFPDHHQFAAKDLDFGDDLPIFMTEKDAIKCQGLADSRMWFVPVTAELDESFYERLLVAMKDTHD